MCNYKKMESESDNNTIWLSLIKKGDSIESTNSREAVGWWADAYSIEPTRPEAIYRIVKRWRYMGRPKVCFEWLAKFNEANMPDDDYDGIEREVWEWRLSEERLICAFYCGIQEVQRDIMNILNKCISSHSIQQALKNYFFYDIRIFSKKEVKLDIADYVKIGDNTELMMYGSTPSICCDKQGYIVNQRLVSYLINSNGSYNLGDSGTVTTVNRQLKLNRRLELVDKFIDYTPPHINEVYNGIEDVKVWKRKDGSLCFLGTHIKNSEPWNDTNISVCIGNYNDTDLINPRILRQNIKSQRSEKNWVFCEDNQIIYQWSPLIVYELFNNESIIQPIHTIHKVPKCFTHMRGSSNGCLVGDEQWFITHIVAYDTPRIYYNHLVVLNAKTKEPLRYSYPFKLSNCKIEFCLGLIVEEDRILIGYSSNDGSTRIGIFEKHTFDKMMISV